MKRGDFSTRCSRAPERRRSHYLPVYERLRTFGYDAFSRRRRMADVSFRNQGITFTVYSDASGHREDFPLRPHPAHHPRRRVARASSAVSSSASPRSISSCQDVYHEQHILRDGIVPRRSRATAPRLPPRDDRRQRPARHLHPHLRHRPDPRPPTANTSCSRTTAARPPASATCSKTAQRLKRVFPPLFERLPTCRPSRTTPTAARLPQVHRPMARTSPTVVVLTPGVLQLRLLRAQLPRPADGRANSSRAATCSSTATASTCGPPRGLRRSTSSTAASTTTSSTRSCFRPDSAARRARARSNAYRAGNVALANAVGTGVADDKAIYPFVPDMIRYYLKRGADPPQRRRPTSATAPADRSTCSSTSTSWS